MNRTPEIVAALRAEIELAPPGDLPAIIGQVASVHAEALARLMTPRTEVPDAGDDRLLTIEETATALNATVRWVRLHKNELPRVKLPGRRLLFSANRLAAFIKRRTA